MTKRFAVRIAVLAVVALALLPIASASAAPAPWWQISVGSRPSNLWTPKNTVQELVKGSALTLVKLKGVPVACIGSPFCPYLGMADTETAAELQTALESPSAYGAGNVEVAEEPASSGHFLITSVGEDAGKSVATLEVEDFLGSGAESNLLQAGGSGRLVVTLTNVGDAALDARKVPLTIEDELPEGVTASEAVASTPHGSLEPVECLLDSETHVTCTFKGTLPSYETIEVEVFVRLTGEPPTAGAPGKVTVSGANAPDESAKQEINASPDPVPFGLESYFSGIEEEGGRPATQAGAHPFQFVTTLRVKSGPATGRFTGLAVKQPALVRNLRFPLPAGLVGNATAVPKCTMSEFFTAREVGGVTNLCPDATAVGAVAVAAVLPKLQYTRAAFPVFNLTPGEGEPARFGFLVTGYPVIIDTAVDPGDQYRIRASIDNTTQLVDFLSTTFVLWGTPGDPRHDTARGWNCAFTFGEGGPCTRPASLSEAPLLRMPVACNGPLSFSTEIEPWNVPIGTGVDSASIEAPGMHGCNRVPFDPSISSSPTSKLAENPSGLDFRVDMPNHGLLEKDAIAEGQAKKVEVTLPEGVTVNPSGGEGLVGCTEADYARETAQSRPGDGCPEASKIGTVKISTPLLEEEAEGALYLAKPYENLAGNSLVALYLVARVPDRGIVIKLAGRVEPDPVTGRLVTTFDDLPQLPFSTFKLHFREGARAPLVTPPSCGTFQTVARFVPWSAQDPNDPAPGDIVERASPFTIEHGVDGGACPTGGIPPFAPQVIAGTQNNAGGSYSPFYMRIMRKDGEQELTRFSTVMPPGLTGNLTGIPFCPDNAIEAAKAHTGQQELAEPSCPAASRIGHTLVGAGVGSVLAYTPGNVYLAGPYHGAPLSVVSITSATVGPFDLGTVVIRFALRINPITAQVEIDATGSDPIPHIIKGIVVHVRDIRVYIDRSNFMSNPTSCAPMSFSATVNGSGVSFASAADDMPVTLGEPFQAADCQALKFKPSFNATTSGKTSRANGASLTVKLTYPKAPQGTQANIHSVKVELPRQLPSRLSTLNHACPDDVFNQNPADCSPQSRVGLAKALTPVLPVPLEGPAYFVSHGGQKFPELVVVLQGYGVTVDLHGETFISKTGVTSSTFKTAPDVPVGSFVLTLPQGPFSALAANTDLCTANLAMPTTFNAQNGARLEQDTPVEVAGCPYSLRIVRRRVVGRNVTLKVSVPVAGRLRASGNGVSTATKNAKGRSTLTMTLKERHGGKLLTKVDLRFTPRGSTGKQRGKRAKILRKSVAVQFG